MPADRPEGVARAAEAAALGARPSLPAAARDRLVTLAERDPDPRVRAVALAALVRAASRATAAAVWRAACRDGDAVVRRRAAELAPTLGRSAAAGALLALLDDHDAWVAEAAAFALGERARASTRIVDALARAATQHADPVVREAAVAALGAIGDPSGLPAVLGACDDKPAIRRRAVLALAAFDGHEVETRLRAALDDPDRQVREAAEHLLRT